MWLARLLRGPFRDVFRVFHPDRHGALALLKPCGSARLAGCNGGNPKPLFVVFSIAHAACQNIDLKLLK
jgi:hypothetical protein